ncbi:MAG: CaiB/BaiF CoA transferase family protein [Dehalococcoidia bacterium]
MNEFLPLAGVRICDFSAVWAGQSATMYLADLGADCIKVENPFIWNPMTRAAAPRIPPAQAQMMPPWMGGHPNGDPGPRPWNNSPAFIHVIRNKRSFTVDSRRPEGVALVKTLIQISDAIAENLAIGTLERLGLDDATVRSRRPDIVILHMPAYGRSGDYVEGRGYGAHIDSVAGATVLRGYPDSAPSSNTQIFAGDFFAGMHGAIALLAALRHRRRTGEGQTIELSQLECSAQMFPQALLDAAWNGRVATTIGNRSIEGFVPNGVFPARGDDRWIAISCRDDGEWSALVAVMGSPAWATDPMLATAEGRTTAEAMIEERITSWTRDRDMTELFHQLQAAGVTAGPVLNAGDAAHDPHLAATGMWQTLPATPDYPETPFHTPPYRFSRSDAGLRTPPAAFGEHNDYVYTDLLGLTEHEREQLRDRGHITDEYADEVLNRGR